MNMSDFVPDIFKSYNINLDGNDTGYQIQRTRPGDFYDWHHDSIGPRILTFIWYLNDIKNAGYTEFLDGTKIQPETGKFMIFPATWNYMHRGVSPKDETKYICKGGYISQMIVLHMYIFQSRLKHINRECD